MSKLWPKEDRKIHKIKQKEFPDFWNYFSKGKSENPRGLLTGRTRQRRADVALRRLHGGSHVGPEAAARGDQGLAGERRRSSGRRGHQRDEGIAVKLMRAAARTRRRRDTGSEGEKRRRRRLNAATALR